MVFDVETLATSPNEAQFQALKRSELMILAKYCNLEVRVSMKKAEIQTLVVESLVGLGTWEEVALDWLPEEKGNMELRKMEMQLQSQERLKELEWKAEKERAERERELEERRAEERAEERRAERELKERDMEYQRELKLKELELLGERREVVSMPANSTTSQNSWDVGRHVRLVPPLNEKEVAKFFLHFDKVAQMLKWPVGSWTMLVQSVLVGKAQDIYSALPIDQCADNYEIVKRAILKAYELVPEAYRQKFRNARKRESETHVEFARMKETMFDRWCDSKEIGKDFNLLRQLILVEEFKQCVHVDIKVHLHKKKVAELYEAATVADDYALTHRMGFHKPNFPPRVSQGSYGKSGSENKFSWRQPREDYGDKSDTATFRDQKTAVPRQTYLPGGPRQPERSQTSATPNALANARNRPWRTVPCEGSRANLQLAKDCEAARTNLKVTQDKMKVRHDKKSQIRNFSPEDRVLLFLHVPGQPLQARYFCPYAIERRVNESDYVVTTPDRPEKAAAVRRKQVVSGQQPHHKIPKFVFAMRQVDEREFVFAGVQLGN
uniref:uncharacterized protein n=2 Tax=Myxine glutinosa TaxID=7769 RepID=UPI00358E6DB6